MLEIDSRPAFQLHCKRGHKAAVQWGLVLLGGLVLVVWSNPTAWTVLIDAALIALAVWLVAVLSRSALRPAA